MRTFAENESGRCSSTPTTRREADAEPSNEEVAEPDQIVSGTAGTGQMDKVWRILSRGLDSVNIGSPDEIMCTNFRWVRHLERQVTRLKERMKAQPKRPVIHRGVWQ